MTISENHACDYGSLLFCYEKNFLIGPFSPQSANLSHFEDEIEIPERLYTDK